MASSSVTVDTRLLIPGEKGVHSGIPEAVFLEEVDSFMKVSGPDPKQGCWRFQFLLTLLVCLTLVANMTNVTTRRIAERPLSLF